MLFYVDVLLGIEKSYQDLVSDLTALTSYSPYCYKDNYYEIFKHIIHSILLEKEVILLDSDFSSTELNELIGDDLQMEQFSVNSKIIMPNISCENLRGLILKKSSTWKITLFTSGTTGIPKKISHSFDSITRNVKQGGNHIEDIWGFAYNPTHMAGLQVFFQALLNYNPLIRLFGQSSDVVLSLIAQYKITHLSATPTFYRLLLPSAKVLYSVKRLTFGGEKFDSSAAQQLVSLFPNAQITNVYASTEAGTLFASQGDKFSIKEEIRHLIKIENQLLFLHKSLIGESTSILLSDGEWYNTGDLTEIISECPFLFKFISRQSEMINVGGYKVNPTEVEQTIREIPGIQDVFVFGKRNSLLGHVICCEVVSVDKKLSEQSIRKFLMKRLQEFKIPRIIRFVDAIATTRSGKISRK